MAESFHWVHLKLAEWNCFQWGPKNVGKIRLETHLVLEPCLGPYQRGLSWFQFLKMEFPSPINQSMIAWANGLRGEVMEYTAHYHLCWPLRNIFALCVEVMMVHWYSCHASLGGVLFIEFPTNNGTKMVEPSIPIAISNSFHSRFLKPEGFNLIKYYVEILSKVLLKLQYGTILLWGKHFWMPSSRV